MKTLVTSTIIALMIPLIAIAQSGDIQQGVTSRPAVPNKINPYQFTMEIKPGESYTEVLEIQNSSNQKTVVQISGVDSGTNDTGSIAFKLSNEEQTEAGKWILPLQPTITMDPGQTIQTEFTVYVPTDTPLGDYLGGISVDVNNVGMTQKDGQNVMVNIRKIEKVNIKVTDNPQPIEKMPPPSIPWTYIYFGVSLAIFVGVLLYLFISKAKKGKKRAK